MAGERGLHRDVRGFVIADLTHEDDVGVLAQQGAQGGGERHADFFVRLRLSDAVEVVLDGVFDGRDVELLLVERAEGGVERRRFTRAGRTGDEDDAVGFVDLVLPDGEGVVVEAELVERDVDAAGVEDTHHGCRRAPGSLWKHKQRRKQS